LHTPEQREHPIAAKVEAHSGLAAVIRRAPGSDSEWAVVRAWRG
jgi:hypothetical protein